MIAASSTEPNAIGIPPATSSGGSPPEPLASEWKI